MMYAPGVIVGRAFDAGYLYALGFARLASSIFIFPPKSHQITLAGSCVYVVSIFMLSLVRPEQYYQVCRSRRHPIVKSGITPSQVFLSQAIGMGVGQGMLFLPALTVIGRHFKRKRALATGIVVTGASAGGIAFPIMLDFLANRVSFTFAIRISAAVVAVLLIVANALVSTPPQQQQPQPQQQQDPPSKHIRAILSDAPYMVSVVGSVPFHSRACGGLILVTPSLKGALHHARSLLPV